MCAIIGSFSKEKIIELCELNRYRGGYAYSISYVNIDSGVPNIHVSVRNSGHVNYNNIYLSQGNYCIVHIQSPTDKDAGTHPVVCNGTMLWHNGIIKRKGNKILDYDTMWDTVALSKHLYDKKSLFDIDGSFACLYFSKSRLQVFRNDLSPLFIDNDMNMSSTTFDNSVELKSGIIYDLDLIDKKFIPTGYFTTHTNPYWIDDTIKADVTCKCGKNETCQCDTTLLEDKEYIYDESGSIIGSTSKILEPVVDSSVNIIKYRYSEDKILDDMREYIDKTYSEHYQTDDQDHIQDLQCVDLWIALGESTPTFRNTAMKYLFRYGKKNGNNKKDLMKALHYIMFALYNDHYKGK
jgi:Protein of unknwon function (DUF3310)